MSLLGSIFGSTAADDTTATSSSTRSQLLLFDKSESLPDRPQHKLVRKIKKKREDQQQRQQQQQESDEGLKERSEIDKRQEGHPPNGTNKKKKRKSDHNANSDDDKDDEASSTKKRKEKKSKTKHEDDDIKDDGVGGDNDADEKKTEKEEDGERTIFVGNLPLATTTRKSLAALFKDFGPIESTRLRSVPVMGVKLPQDRAGDQRLMKKVCVNTNQINDSTKNTIHGYVVFTSVDSVNKALEKNNAIVVEGMRLRIDRATPTVDASRSVFVGNLPYLAEESTLLELFTKGCVMEPGDVQGVRIVRDKETYQCKGFGYVLFREKSMVPTALKMDGSTYMKKELRVRVCGKRFKGKKGDNKAAPTKPKYAASAENSERVTVGAFRRIIAKQQLDNAHMNQRKRGERKKAHAVKAAAGGISKRAALDKKVDKRVKKLEKRVSKGMGKTRRRS